MPNNATEHTVVSGETLSKIAEAYYGDPILYKSLVRYNSLENPDDIKPGDVIKIPRRASSIKSAKKNGNETHLHIVCRNRKSSGSGGMVFYVPSSDEYLEIEYDSIGFLEEEAETTEELAKLIQAAWTASDFTEACEKAQEAEEKLETVLGSKTQVTASDTFEELLLCRGDKNKRWGKPIVYARKKRLRDRIKTGKGVRALKRARDYERKELNEFLGLDNKPGDSKANPLNTVKANFWKTEAGGDGVWKFTARNEDGNKDVLADNDHFSLSAEAQLLRFAAGASIASDVTSLLRGKPKFSVGGQGHVSFSLVEGTAEGSYSFPSKNGYNILELFSNEKLEEFIHDGRTCHMLFKAALNGYGFVGANATAIIGLPQIDFTENDGSSGNGKGRNMDAYGGGNFAAGATATAGGSLACTVEWKGHDTPSFAALGEVKGCGEVSAGAAIEILAQAGLMDGELRVRLGARAVAGLGGKLGTEVALGLDEGYKFVSYLMRSVDSHYVAELVGDSFQVLTRKSVAVITDVQEAVSDGMGWGKDLVLKAFTWGRQRGIDVKAQMVERLNSGALTEQVRYVFAEGAGFIILGIMELPEDGDHSAILTILRPAKKHTLKSILRVVGADTEEMKKLPKPKREQTKAYEDWQGKALQAGIRSMGSFGTGMESYSELYRPALMEILRENDITIQ